MKFKGTKEAEAATRISSESEKGSKRMTVVQIDQWRLLAKLLVLAKASGNSQGPRDSEQGSEVDQSFAAEVVNFRAHRHRAHSAGVGEGHCDPRPGLLDTNQDLGARFNHH